MNPHIIEGQFQSDKYPGTPRGFLPLKFTDPDAQDLIAEYGRRHYVRDAVLSEGIAEGLERAGWSSPSDDVQIQQALRYRALACVHGFNAIAKIVARTLGEKAYCRLARDAARATFARLGGVVQYAPEEDPILTLPEDEARPEVVFKPGDVELMRACVAAYDARPIVPPQPPPPGPTAGSIRRPQGRGRVR